ncbi:MAG: DUF2231 domain-containing protein [Chloroflexota bacterium]
MELVNRILYNLIEVHPLHPLLVHFPIALTSAALFFILIALWRRSDALEQVAFANIALAAVSTLAAGVTGLMDNQNTYDGVAPNAKAKIVLASILLVLTALMSIVRWRRPDLFHSPLRLAYVGGYFVSFSLVAVLGFLGGVILYGFEAPPVVPVTGNNTSLEVSQPIPTPTSAAAVTGTPTPTTGVSFASEIAPILKSRCLNCHGGQKTEEGLDVSSYEALMAGSENGAVIIPGDAENSLLGQTLIEREMPKRGPKLSPEQAQTIIDWINQGALDN